MKAMKRSKLILCAALCGALFLGALTLHAADVKTYQVTGPVLEVTPTTIVVQKGEDRWEIARGRGTKVTGKIEVGAKVTVYYRMVADEVEVKDAKGKK
jgi:hypothetical protein